MTSESSDEVFRRQKLFDVYDANQKGEGFFPQYWEHLFKTWEAEGLLQFDMGYWLTGTGKKILSAL